MWCGFTKVYEAQKNELHSVGVDLQGSVSLHTSVSLAGRGLRTSNKYDIESSIPTPSKFGVKNSVWKR